MASEPFRPIQTFIVLPHALFGDVNTKDSLSLTYTNQRLRDPQPHAPELSHVRHVRRTVELFFEHNKIDPIGHFTIEGFGVLKNGRYESFGSGYTNYMTISIDDEQHDLRGKGISRVLINGMMKGIESDGINIDEIKDQKLFIDVDANGWFWNHIGMVKNPRGINWKGPKNEEGNGYEKMITLGGILHYLRTPSKLLRRSHIRESSRRSTSRSPRGSPRRSTSRSPRGSPRWSPRRSTRRSIRPNRNGT